MASTELSESAGTENTMAWSPVATAELIVAPGDRFHVEHSRIDFRTFGDPYGSLVMLKHGELHPKSIKIVIIRGALFYLTPCIAHRLYCVRRPADCASHTAISVCRESGSTHFNSMYCS